MGLAIPIIGIGLSIVGTAIAAKGQLDMAEYQAGLNARNAAIMRENALAAVRRGESNAELLTLQGSQVIGKQRAAAGASGVDVGSESVLDVLSSTRFFNRLDVQTTRYNALMEGRGYGVQAMNYEGSAEMARLAGAYGAASTIIGGVGNIMSLGYGSNLFPKFGK